MIPFDVHSADIYKPLLFTICFALCLHLYVFSNVFKHWIQHSNTFSVKVSFTQWTKYHFESFWYWIWNKNEFSCQCLPKRLVLKHLEALPRSFDWVRKPALIQLSSQKNTQVVVSGSWLTGRDRRYDIGPLTCNKPSYWLKIFKKYLTIAMI